MAAKRKRDAQDLPGVRAAPPPMPENEFPNYELGAHANTLDPHTDPNLDDFATMLEHHAGDQSASDQQHLQHHIHGQQQHRQGQQQRPGEPNVAEAANALAQYHTMTVPQSTESAFMKDAAEQQGDGGRELASGQQQQQDQEQPQSQQHRTGTFGGFELDSNKEGQIAANGEGSPVLGPGGVKPQVGSDEWHKIRRDNHKEVERRRRETINEGINELAKIVPGCEKNKGSILSRAVQFITQLKENETQNIEKWQLEKMLTEQAISELSATADKLKAERQRAVAECERWKQAAKSAGVSLPDTPGDTGDQKAAT